MAHHAERPKTEHFLERRINMYLFDKPLTHKELKNELDMLEGDISRICVTDNVTEVSTMLGFAVDRLNMI